MSSTPTRDDVLELIRAKVTDVLGLDDTTVDARTRFDEDLHADSLDLLEVVEGVEKALRDQGYAVEVADDELLAVATVGEAADCITAGLGAGE